MIVIGRGEMAGGRRGRRDEPGRLPLIALGLVVGLPAWLGAVVAGGRTGDEWAAVEGLDGFGGAGCDPVAVMDTRAAVRLAD